MSEFKSKIRLQHEIDNKERIRIANFISCVACGRDVEGIPYKPNEHDDSFWTVDDGNDWKVKFFNDDLNLIEIIHRYRNKEAINNLTYWLSYRIGGIVE